MDKIRCPECEGEVSLSMLIQKQPGCLCGAGSLSHVHQIDKHYEAISVKACSGDVMLDVTPRCSWSGAIVTLAPVEGRRG